MASDFADHAVCGLGVPVTGHPDVGVVAPVRLVEIHHARLFPLLARKRRKHGAAPVDDLGGGVGVGAQLADDHRRRRLDALGIAQVESDERLLVSPSGGGGDT